MCSPRVSGRGLVEALVVDQVQNREHAEAETEGDQGGHGFTFQQKSGIGGLLHGI